jgi:glycolate oxidase iron-sulfur subunit
MCLSVCPSYREFVNELHSPRGRLALAQAFISGEISGSKQLFNAISHCLLCSACNSVCPGGIKPAEAVMWIRADERFRKHTSRLERLLLRKIVRGQRALRLLTSPIRFYQRLGVRQILRRFGLLQLLPSSISNLESLLPDYQGEPFLQSAPDVVPALNTPRGDITFFSGCAMNLFFPRANRATVEIASRLGWNVKIPKEVFCCGAPHLHEGDLETARSLALRNMELLLNNGATFVVTDCASCTAMFKTYPQLFDEGTPEYREASEFAGKVKDVTEFFQAEISDASQLDYSTPNSQLGNNVRVAYDSPCELSHVLGIKDAPQALLARLPGVCVIEIPARLCGQESDWCCGSAGAYSLKHPDMAQRILQHKIEDIRESAPDYLLSSNPGCLLHIGKGLRECPDPPVRPPRCDRGAGSRGVRLMHLSEFLKMIFDN